MKLIALALALVLEHVATQLLHLRELRWFDGYFDAGLRWIGKWPRWALYPGLVLIVAVLVLPVAVLRYVLQGTEIVWDVAYLAFGVLVLFFCLGPRDLGTEVDEFRKARRDGDDETADRVLREMSESQDPRAGEIDVVEDAIFVQSNNRIFGVIFWFMLLGPVGAWVFRVSDLLRRRVVFEHGRTNDGDTQLVAVAAIYGVLKWVPARLAMLGFALSGSFDDAMNAWRGEGPADANPPIDQRNDLLVARVGKSSMTGYLDEPANSGAAARNAMRIVRRTVFIWLTVIALMSLFGYV